MSMSRAAMPVVVVTVTLLFGACNVGSDRTFVLDVPYFAQPAGSLDCGPATVQMWAGYDKGAANAPSQQTIADYIGTTSCGSSPQGIAEAVNHFTYATNAFVDIAASDWETEEFMSRQITSIDNYSPAIAIVNGGFHAVIVVGGTWSDRSDGNYQWDYVEFHDPLVGPNLRNDSASWIFESCPLGSTCQQIVDGSAIVYSSSNLAGYGDSVYDSSGCGSGGCTQEYQY